MLGNEQITNCKRGSNTAYLMVSRLDNIFDIYKSLLVGTPKILLLISDPQLTGKTDKGTSDVKKIHACAKI